MDFIRSYPSLLEQSRFYFPPLTSVRGGPLSDQRPSSELAPVSGLTPLMLHASALHEGGGGLVGGRGEREIPLDLSLKTIRQTPDSTADDDLVLLQQRIEMARSNAIQVAAVLAGKKYPFSPLELTSANARLRDSFLHQQSLFSSAHHLAPPPPPLIRPLASATPTLSSSTTSSSSSVNPGFSRAPTSAKSDGGGSGSAFVTPHAAVCGGLNGFCLDPRRCRLAASGGTHTGSGESNHAAASAFHAYATALYERHMSKMMSVASTASTNTSISQSVASGALQGLLELRMTSVSLPSTSSSSKTTMTSSTTSSSATPSTTSSVAIKTPFPVAVSEQPFFHPSFSLPLAPYHLSQSHSNGGNAFHDAHHHHNHPNRLSKDPNCACCNVSMAKSYPLSCLCCYPGVIPALAGGRGAFEALFPPSTAVPVVIPNLPTFNGHLQTTSGEQQHPKPKSSKHHHHHNHHHHHHHSKHERNSDVTSKHATDSKKVEVVKEEAKCRVLPSSPSLSVSIKQPSPPEGGRWIPHLHSSQSEKMNTAASKASTTTENNAMKSSSNKVFAPVVRIPPSPPEGVYQGPAKTPSPHINSASVPPPPPSPAINRPTAFTAVYPITRAIGDVSTPPLATAVAPKRPHVRKAEVIEDRCSPPKMARLTSNVSETTAVVKKEEQEVMWIPTPTNTTTLKDTSLPQTPEVTTEKKKTSNTTALLNRVWEANYTSDNVRQVPVVLAVTPMDVTETPNVTSVTHSPVEASPATLSGRKEASEEESSKRMIRLTESPSVNVRAENVVSPLVLKAATSVDQEKTCWKRVSASEPSSLTSSPAKKLKKKDVIVISMKDEHQISANLVMKSVKRKLDEPRRHSNGGGMKQEGGQRSPPGVNRYKIAELKHHQLSSQPESPDIDPSSTVVHTASIVTTTTTTTTAKFISCQPEVVTQQVNDDKNSILKLSVKIPAAYNNNNNNNNSNVIVSNEVNLKVTTQASPAPETEEKVTPAVRITLTKTGGESGSTAVYKSSVVPSSVNPISSTVATTSVTNGNEFSPAMNATAAMLRRYYEDQKLRLQQAEEFNRLRFTKGNNPLTNAPLKDTLASSSSPSSRPSPPVTTITTIDTKPKTSLVLSTASPVVSAVAAVDTAKCNVVAPGKVKKAEVDEAADDGDDEREDEEEEEEEDDDEEDDDYDDDENDEDYESDAVGRKTANKDAAKKRATPTNTNHDRTHVLNKSNQGTTNGEKIGSHRSDNNSKRVMYNKALGETMLHRSARLGQLEHLKYYLETQSSTMDAKDNAGYSPLHECCSRGHIDAARMLLQYGADVNSAATGGVRPIHDAVENDYLEVVRLLLSYGADPLIATYAGQTPVKLAKSPAMIEFFKGFLADVSGEYVTPILPWQFRGSARCFDVKPSGYDPLDDLPSDNEQPLGHNRSNNGDDCDVDDDAALIFEVSDKPHIPTYHVPTTRRNGSGTLNFCLLHDVLNQTGMNRGAFVACYPDVIVERMARQEFLNQAKCAQIMVDSNAAVQANCPSSVALVELVHWNSNLRDILDIERVSISTTACKSQKNIRN